MVLLSVIQKKSKKISIRFTKTSTGRVSNRMKTFLILQIWTNQKLLMSKKNIYIVKGSLLPQNWWCSIPLALLDSVRVLFFNPKSDSILKSKIPILKNLKLWQVMNLFVILKYFSKKWEQVEKYNEKVLNYAWTDKICEI